MLPFFNDVSRENLPGDRRGGFFHENDPGRQTILSRIFSIFNNVANLEMTPEVRAILANRRNPVQINQQTEQIPANREQTPPPITPEDVMSQPLPSETTQPNTPKSLEEIRLEVDRHAVSIGSRMQQQLPEDVVKSISSTDLSRGA